jgi:hypothetical protein
MLAKLLVLVAVLAFAVLGVGLVAYLLMPETGWAQEEARFRAALEAFVAEGCARIEGGCPQ